MKDVVQLQGASVPAYPPGLGRGYFDMKTPVKIARAGGLSDPQESWIETTLYELIQAIQDEVSPEEDELVALIVNKMIQRGRIRFLNYQ